MTEKDFSSLNPENAIPKLLAFYLPQFHPVPENDQWWGKGYTEWTNVARAQPAFEGHYQPRLPSDLGYYDLRLPEVREEQANLARQHGVSGFCYYHYWFNGRRLLERPFEEVLESGHPDFPFCLAWANHTWTWKRDHGHDGRLVEQSFSEEDDLNHIRWLLEVFKDRRYIRLNGRPLLLVYWVQSIPDPKRTFDLWREEAEKSGEKLPYICKMDSFGNFDDPIDLGCDAAVEFWPHNVNAMVPRIEGAEPGYMQNKVYEYRQFAISHLNRLRGSTVKFTRFPCVVPQWDNTARWKASGANILHGSTPELYRSWLSQVIGWSCENLDSDERLIFINAWNEWGEGAYLEPDLKYGRAYLEATSQALMDNGFDSLISGSDSTGNAIALEPASLQARYEKLETKLAVLQEQLSHHHIEEEKSLLVQRVEQNYRLLDKQYQELKVQHNALRRKFNLVSNQLQRLEAQTLLEFPSTTNTDREELVTLLTHLDSDVTTLLNSKRWRLTAKVVDVMDRLRNQAPSKNLENHIRRSLKNFRAVKRK